MMKLALSVLGLFTVASPSSMSVHADNHDVPTLPRVTAVDYEHQGDNLRGYLSMPENSQGPIPAVVFIPDWDGVSLYEQQRATMVADELGWAGFAADIFGSDLQDLNNSTLQGQLVGFYRNDNPEIFVGRIQAAVEKVRAMPEVDGENIAIVGFCFGGTGVLQYAMQGGNGVKAIVSIHGGLTEVPDPTVEVFPNVLVLSGGKDDASSEIIDLENKLDAVNATWEITRFSGIQHAWTVFEDSRYNKFADMRAWESMVHFLHESFGEITFQSQKPTAVNVEGIDYVDVDGTELRGYLALPDPTKWMSPFPAVVILPDWDGVNLYEQERATMLAKLGYAAFAADIYGADLQTDLDFPTRFEQTALYRNDQPELFVQRIIRAVELVKEMPEVDADNIALFGYCFGGTGVIFYALTDRTDVKVVGSFHGGLDGYVSGDIPEQITPRIMILSGGEDDQHGNQTTLENAFNEGKADWEITRWSDVQHGFTGFDGNAYNLRADARSWEQTLSVMAEVMNVPRPLVESQTSAASFNGAMSSVALALSAAFFYLAI